MVEQKQAEFGVPAGYGYAQGATPTTVQATPTVQAPQGAQGVDKFITGGLTNVPEVRTTQNGSPVCDLNLAVTGANGQIQYVKVSVWGNSCYYLTGLKKGDRVAAYGKLTKKAYTAKDGTQKSSLDLNYASVFLDFGFILQAVARMMGQSGTAAPVVAGDIDVGNIPDGFELVTDEEVPF